MIRKSAELGHSWLCFTPTFFGSCSGVVRKTALFCEETRTKPKQHPNKGIIWKEI